MEPHFYCNDCKTSFARKSLLTQHLTSRKHLTRTNGNTTIALSLCGCGKSYSHKKSLEYHKKNCDFKVQQPTATPIGEDNRTIPPTATEILLETMQHKLETYEKEREEMKAQITLLLDKHAGAGTTTNLSGSGTTNNTNSHNIKTQQNIIININAFGNENTDYIDEKAIISCIGLVYKSIPSLLEKIHFDPKHPENHNIKITNKKLPYASVMGNNQKWKTVDRKDAIETMVQNGYNMLDEKYVENKDKFAPAKQQKFEGFLAKIETEDKDVMRQIKSEVDMMVLNGGN
jgi:hypothetical protein